MSNAVVNKQDELNIIKRICNGDHAAFAVLVNAYQHMAVTLAYNILLNHADAEDVAQDAFIKAYKSLRSFKGNSRFSTWLYRIVVNTALNKQQRTKLFYVDEPATQLEETEENDETSLIYSDQKKYIARALLNIAEQERICITLYYLHELSIAEIEEITGFTTTNIKQLLFRGRKHLHIELKRLLNFELKDLI